MAETPSTFSEPNTRYKNKINAAKPKVNKTFKNQNKAKIYTKKSQSICEFNSLMSETGEKNLLSDSNAFLRVSNIFEDILDQLTHIDNNEVYERLLQIHNKIQRKISSANILTEEREIENSSLSKSLASSLQSLCSVTSVSEHFDENDMSFKDFLLRVNCPFCSKLEPDKINLIKHMDENCRALKMNVFEETKDLLYSAFQILPNKTFKCNICNTTMKCNPKYFFAHTRSDSHKLAFTTASKSKKFTEFLYCSCCKILIPNNYTQLNHHINHWVHNLRANSAPDKLSKSVKKECNCVYQFNKKFKCLDCPLPSLHNSPKNILEHFEIAIHVKETKTPRLPNIFCEFCAEKIHIFEVLSHFTSQKHLVKEKNQEAIQELCSYCNFACPNLTDLSLHMKTGCQEINHLRVQNKIEIKVEQNVKETGGKPNNNETGKNQELKQVEPNNYETGKNQELKQVEPNNYETGKNQELKQVEPNNYQTDKDQALKEAEHCPESKTEILDEKYLTKDKSIDRERIKTEKGLHITVKGNTKLPELYKYFQKFGEIATMEICGGEEVLIGFREKNVVEDILLLRGVIKIGGVKVEISEVENLDKSFKENKKRPDDSEVSSNSNQKASFNNINNNGNNDDDLGGTVMKNREVDELFSRVSHHLHHSTRKYMDDVTKQIIEDCNKFFHVELVGFVACGLSFPVENISFYCKELRPSAASSEVYSTLTNGAHFQRIWIMKCSTAFFDSCKWKDPVCCDNGEFPYIEYTHRQTNKICTFMFLKCTRFLTIMLRHCLNEKWMVRSFCLLLRFWLAVHEVKIREFEYSIISLLIFFLLNEDVVDPFTGIQELSDHARQFNTLINAEIGPREVTTSSGRHITEVRELFNKFLYFLLKFDFDHYAICLPIIRPIPKTLLRKLPFSSFLRLLNTEDLLNSSICIIDPYLNVNLASGINKHHLDSFLEIVRSNYT